MRPPTKLTPSRILLVVVICVLAINVIAVAVVAIGNAVRPPAGLEGIARSVTALDGVQGVRPGEAAAPQSDWIADGVVIMEPDATAEQVKKALDTTGAFVSGQAKDAALRVDAMSLAVGTTVLRVYPDSADNAEQVAVLEKLPELSLDDAGVIGAGLYGDSLQLTIDSPAGLIEAAVAARTLAAASGLYDEATAVVRTVDDQFSYATPPSTAATAPAALVFSAVADRFPLSAATLTATSADLTLGFRANGDDIASATALAESAGDGSIEVAVHGAFGDQGPDPRVRDLISAARSVSGLRDIHVTGSAPAYRIRYDVASPSAGYVVYAAVKDLPEFSRLRSFSLGNSDGPMLSAQGDFSITATPNDAPQAMALLNALTSTGVVRLVDLDYGEEGIARDNLYRVELIDDSEKSIKKVVAQLKSEFGGAAIAQVYYTDLSHAAVVGGTFAIGPSIEVTGITGEFRNQARSDQFQSTLTSAWND